MSYLTLVTTRHDTAAARNPRNAGTVDCFHIAGRVGQAHLSFGRIVKLIDAMIEDEGFPAPFPHLRHGKLYQRASKDAAWPQVAVDLWFDDRLPPAALGRVAGAERVAIDSRLSASAAHLFDGDAA